MDLVTTALNIAKNLLKLNCETRHLKLRELRYLDNHLAELVEAQLQILLLK